MAAATLRNWASSYQIEPSSQARVTVVDNVSKIPSQPAAVVAAFDEMLTRLDAIRKLKRDWDSYGAESPSKASLSLLRSLLGTVVVERVSLVGARAIPFLVAPNPDGGVIAEWRHATKLIEVDVNPDGMFSYFLKLGADQTEEQHGITDPTIILTRIASVVD